MIGSGAIDTRRQFVIERPENVNLTRGASAFPIAAPGDLDNRIQRAERTSHDGKIHVHAGFDELSGDDAAGLVGAQPFTDGLDQSQAMLRT